MKKIVIPWLEIPLTEHCNLKCKGCTHHSPFLKPRFYEFEQYKADINAIKDILHITRLIFLGGEPLLNKQISDYISYAKQSKIADIYSVVTNGLLLAKMNDAFFELIDEIKVSLYPDVGIKEEFLEIFLKEKSEALKYVYRINYYSHFENTETNLLSNDIAQNNFNKCERHKNGHFLYNGYYYKCFRPISTKQFLEYRNTSTPSDFKVNDGVSLAESNLFLKIQEYINCKEKLLSCHYCLNGLRDKSVFDSIKASLGRSNYITKFIYRHNLVYYSLVKFYKIYNNNLCKNKFNKHISQFKHQQLTQDELF